MQTCPIYLQMLYPSTVYPLLKTLWDRPKFLFAMLFIWIVSSIMLYVYHRIFPSRKVLNVGFSGVIFGLIVIYYTLLNNAPGITTLGLIVSILPQLIGTRYQFRRTCMWYFGWCTLCINIPTIQNDIATPV